jgi:uncharacterized protein YraI
MSTLERTRPIESSQPEPAGTKRGRAAAAIMLLALMTLACSATDLVTRQRTTPTPPDEVVLVPTFTPSPVPQQTLVIVTPPSEGRPGVIIVPPGMNPDVVMPLPPPTTQPTQPTSLGIDQATLVPGTDVTDTPGPTPTATIAPPTPTNTPIPTATPYITVPSGLITLRTGPGIDYPQVTQLGPNIPIAITGKNEQGTWLQICCISGESLWIPTVDVIVHNDVTQLPVAPVQPPPPPTATATDTITPTPSPTPTATPYPFQKAIGPQYFPSSNEFLTIWAKLFVGTPPLEEAAPGYYLTVFFEGFERPNDAGDEASSDVIEFSAPPGSGSRVEYNYKYEYHPPDPRSVDPTGALSPLQLLGTGTWTVYVSDGTGRQLSDPVTFTTAPDNPNREIYIGWERVR